MTTIQHVVATAAIRSTDWQPEKFVFVCRWAAAGCVELCGTLYSGWFHQRWLSFLSGSLSS